MGQARASAGLLSIPPLLARAAGREIVNAFHNIAAIGSITFKDALRKKVLVTILFFAVLVGVSALFPWVRAEFRMRQMTRTCLAGMSFFGMVAAVFLAAPNLPDDISKKTIFTVLTKPARRWHILAGKILGLAYMLAVMLAVMGIITFVWLRFWDWKMGADPTAPPRLDGHKRIYAATVEYGGFTLNVSQPMIESQRAIASGYDRITFNFEGLDRERFRGDTVYAQVVLFSHGFSYDGVSEEGTGALQATNPTTGETTSEIFGAATLIPENISFPKRMIDGNGRLVISLITRLKSGSYSALASSVAVLSQPSGFAMNFIKGLVLMFMQFMVLVFVATAASTFLTSTVSIITALFVYFTGSLTEIVRAQALKLGTEANIFTMAEHSHEGGASAVAGLQLALNYLLRYFYIGISVAFPNLPAYNPSPSISASEFLPASALWQGLAYGALYAFASFAIAWAVFRRKEVA